jgi:predicted nucleotidyltransferase
MDGALRGFHGRVAPRSTTSYNVEGAAQFRLERCEVYAPSNVAFYRGAIKIVSSIIVADLVKAYFASRKEIVAAFLFGTYAQNRQRPDSDVDVGVLLAVHAYPNAGELRTRYTVELGRALRKVVHPVILNTAGEELLRQIFTKGKCLQVNDQHAYASFQISAYCRIADFDYYRKLTQRGFINRLQKEMRGD